MSSNDSHGALTGKPYVFRAPVSLCLWPLLALLAGPAKFAVAQAPDTSHVSASTNVLTLDKHFFDQSSSYCGGDNILFYKASTGEGLVGKLTRVGFQQTEKFGLRRFALGWTQVAKVDPINSILFYQSSTGYAALGVLDHGKFTTTKTYDNFSHGWTNILYVGLNNNHALFYNSDTSAAAYGFAPSQNLRKGEFSAGWTHIVWNHAGTLFYDTHLGSGAIAEPTVSGSPGPFAAPNALKTTQTYQSRGLPSDWTHVAATKSHIFFYNRVDGSAAIAVLSPSNLETRKTYRLGRLSAQWTHVVSAGNEMLLFYNAITGSAAVGEIVGDEFQGTASFGPGSLPRGFTHVVCAADTPTL